ncbi:MULTISPECIES: hypothetical protein [Mycobacteriaceae]|uniref:hypothetical protein n=1 Tax=Mycobacteriaceae TaxID=1762 RepID=UPI000AD7A6AF|nr:hypothetical protein [Mycolicibacterium mucogenicum]
MGMRRGVVRVALSTRTADDDDHTAIAGTPLWVVSWTVRERPGHERTWSAPSASETGARTMVQNLLAERLPGLSESDVYSEELD